MPCSSTGLCAGAGIELGLSDGRRGTSHLADPLPLSQRGDLLFLTMPHKAPLKLGDITVYKVAGAPIPIVHRVIETHDE